MIHRRLDPYLIKSLFFIPQWNFDGIYPLLVVGWTLNIEMYFYALFALALSLSRRWAPFIAGAAILLVFALKRYSTCESVACAVYGNDYVVFFPTGIAAYYLWTACRRWAARFPLITGSIGAAIVTAFLAWQLEILPPLTAWDSLALPTLIVLVALFCESAKWKAGVWALVMGNVSYALYLTHPFVVDIMRRLVDSVHIFWAMLVIMVLSVILGGCTHYVVERPMTTSLRDRLRSLRASESASALVR
jgi:exopolysaccharide production protein ExoZ